MANSIAVGLAEIKISKDPQDVLVAFGLGSCLGIGFYDPVLKLGGMLHAVLPRANDHHEQIPAKYVDTGIKALLDELVKSGGVRSRFSLKVAGGANMLNVSNTLAPFDIGTRNIEMARIVFADLGIKPKSEEVGGKVGRTVRMYIADGRMTIRMMGEQERDF